MSDPLRTLLHEEADRRAGAESVPPVSVVRQQAVRRVRRPTRALVPVLLVPLMVAATVSGAVLALQQRRPAPVTAPVLTVPPPPVLGKVVPPMTVRTRLGAPGGHVNGPPVPSADLLAVSPSAQDGLVLRTVAVVRGRPQAAVTPERQVDRCLYTYTDPRAQLLKGECDWGTPRAGRPAGTPLTLDILGPPGRTWLTGTAPVGTAAVVFRSAGRPDMVIATGDPGPAWAHRPHYAGWWPRTATDVVAVARDGRELGRNRLASDVPVRTSPDDPELGTVEPPASVQDDVSEQSAGYRPARQPVVLLPGERVDVLARLAIDDHVTLWTYGLQKSSGQCVIQYEQDVSGDRSFAGSSRSCGPGRSVSALNVSRSLDLEPGNDGGQRVSGSAPAGTRRIRLTAPGVPAQEYAAFNGGPRWRGTSFFLAAWPTRAVTTVTALTGDGAALASTTIPGYNPKGFDPDYLAAVAGCLAKAGVKVTSTPQGQDAGPAYNYDYGELSPGKVRQLTDRCEAVADRQTG